MSACPYCGNGLQPREILWQGIHTCVESRCERCKIDVVEDLKVGHAIFNTYQVNVTNKEIFGPQNAMSWFGRPLLASLCNPDQDFQLEFKIEKFREIKIAVILNCIDYLYGHALLKLLNAEKYVGEGKPGLVVIIPRFLRWMVPEYIAEIWTVNIPLGKAQSYFPAFNGEIQKQLTRFEEVYCSLAHAHPAIRDIKQFTGVEPHDLSTHAYRITYIWREDRFWCGNNFALRIFRKIGWKWPLLWMQRLKVVGLFSRLRNSDQLASFTVAGLGRSLKFPDWIEDVRVREFTAQSEKESCRIYSASRLIIGVHGSNMLLPSGHAGMTLDLMPTDRWGNLAQDVIYQPIVAKKDDERIVSWRYRYIPTSARTAIVAIICKSIIEDSGRAFQLCAGAPN
jgi:hypothetical protein